MENDYQRPEGTPEPEGRTASRSPFPGWLRNHGNGWLGRVDPRQWKAAILNHQIDKKDLHVDQREDVGKTHTLCPLCEESVRRDLAGEHPDVAYMDGWHHTRCLDSYFEGTT